MLGGVIGVALACGAPAAPPPAPSPVAPAPAAASEGRSVGTAPTEEPRAATAASTVVKVGVLGTNISNAGVYIGAERGYFQEQGIVVDAQPFDAGSRMVPALATNELQVGGGGASAGLFNSAARGIRNKVVADKGSGPPGAGWQALLIRKDLYENGTVTRLEELRGKTLAIVATDSTMELSLVRHLSLAGLGLSDLNVIELPFSD